MLDDLYISDRLACQLRMHRERLVLPLARAAHALASAKAWSRFGYSSLEDFARERLGRTGRWMRDLAALQEALLEFPDLATALSGDDGARPIGRVAALLVARCASKESLPIWIELARRSSVRQLRAAVRRARLHRSEWPLDASAIGVEPETRAATETICIDDATAEIRGEVGESRREGAGGSTAEDPECDEPDLVRISIPLIVRLMFDETLDLHRAISGHDASVVSFVEALAGEAQAGLQPIDVSRNALQRGVPTEVREEMLARSSRNWQHLEDARVGGGCVAGGDQEAGGDAAGLGDQEGDRVAGDLAAAAQAAATMLDEIAGLEAQADAAALVDRMQRLVALEDEIDRQVGLLLAAMGAAHAWSRLRFASLAHYGEERLGLCRRTAESRAWLARGLDGLPLLREAYSSGHIGCEAMLLVRRALGPGPVREDVERAWVRHAERLSIKRLRDELRLRRLGGAGLECEELDGDMEGELQDDAASRNGPGGAREGASASSAEKPLPPHDAAWHASLFRAPGLSRRRLTRMGESLIAGTTTGMLPMADVFLSLRAPADVSTLFLAAIEGRRGQLAEAAERATWDFPALAESGGSGPWWGEPADGSSLAFGLAHVFSQRCRRVPAWVGLVALLEDFVCTWDQDELVPRRRWEAIYRRDGYRCMAPGCTARAQLENHHLWYRSALGPNDPWNCLCLCRFHHHQGEHGILAKCRGRAPIGVGWRLGRRDVASWWFNERRLDELTVAAACRSGDRSNDSDRDRATG